MSDTREQYSVLKGQGLRRGRLLLFETLPSTNAWALLNVHKLRHGDVVAAKRQTAGKGRFDRAWLVPADRGIAVTVVLAEIGTEEVLCNIGRCAAMAVRECLLGFSIPSNLKWPNDVMAGDRKISGILAERDSESGAIFLGMGLNVNVSVDDLSAAGLSETATSMSIEHGKLFDVETVRRSLLKALDLLIERLLKEGVSAIENTWNAFDWLDGSILEIEAPHGLQTGEYCGVDRMGRLRLRDSKGREHVLSSGDVRKIHIGG